MNKETLKSVVIIVVIIAFFTCLSIIPIKQTQETKIISKNNRKTEKKESKEDEYWFVDNELEEEKEKIQLLSILKNIPEDSLKLIMRDYLFETEQDSLSPEKIINSISKKYNLSKHRLASIFFSYKYEMLTKEDIENDFVDDEIRFKESISEAEGSNN